MSRMVLPHEKLPATAGLLKICEPCIVPDPLDVSSLAEQFLAADTAAARRHLLGTALPVSLASDLAEKLKHEADRLLAISPTRSLEVARSIDEVAVASGSDGIGIGALGVLAEADALRELGRYRDASAAYDRAAETYRAIGDEVGWARTRIGWILTCRFTGARHEAIAEAEPARAILAAHGLWLRLARLEGFIGSLSCELGQLVKILRGTSKEKLRGGQRVCEVRQKEAVGQAGSEHNGGASLMAPTPTPSSMTPFATLPDPRVDRTPRHAVLDVRTLALCAVICGADSWVEVERFGQAKAAWFGTFLALPHGIPCHATFGRVFARLDPAAFERCLLAWVQGMVGGGAAQGVAVAGKTRRAVA